MDKELLKESTKAISEVVFTESENLFKAHGVKPQKIEKVTLTIESADYGIEIDIEKQDSEL